MSELNLSPAQLIALARCEKLIGYEFQNKRLLAEALTHASGAPTRLRSNERLEFLGDAVLGFVACDILFEQFPDLLEGDLTKIKSILVSRQTCTAWGEQFQLKSVMQLGKGILSHGDVPSSLLGDVFESIVGAIYRDGGVEPVRDFLRPLIVEECVKIRGRDSASDFKSALQHYTQRHFGVPPVYQLLEERGPDHVKSFLVAVVIGANRYPATWGKTKKEAEQKAACEALKVVMQESPPAAKS